MSNLTPVRVRGKRTGTAAEKGRDKPRRKSTRPREYFVRCDTSSRAGSKDFKKRKRHMRDLAMIEQLPVELIEDIFERSRNLEFPAASPIILQQLAHMHLYKRVLQQAMLPLLSRSKQPETSHPVVEDTEDISHAVRVVNSRFCTWELLSDWLCQSRGIKSVLKQDPPGIDYASVVSFNWHVDSANNRLQAAVSAYHERFKHSIRPMPSKLLKGPFSSGREKLIVLLAHQYSDFADIDTLIPRDDDLHMAIEDAVSQRKIDLVIYMMSCVASPRRIESMAPGLLRTTIIGHGCIRDVVMNLLDRAHLRLPEQTNLYFELWQWAEEAERAGSHDGQWLKQRLRASRL